MLLLLTIAGQLTISLLIDVAVGSFEDSDCNELQYLKLPPYVLGERNQIIDDNRDIEILAGGFGRTKFSSLIHFPETEYFTVTLLFMLNVILD